MKLLFDQNISWRVVKHLAHVFPKAKQVRELGLEGKTDREIWNFALQNQYAIVTFDGDFYDLVTLYGHPPKIVWLRTGNTSTQSLIKVLDHYAPLIREFLLEKEYSEIGCLEIDNLPTS